MPQLFIFEVFDLKMCCRSASDHFNADPGAAFYSDAHPYPTSQIDANPD
jgi:hypothetical protein